MSDALLTRVGSYYSEKLATHGATPAGVDWSSADSQTLRFRQLVRVCDEPGRFSFIDYGCGYGAFAPYLRQTGMLGSYVGYDIASDMVEAARALHPDADCRFVSRREELDPADFTVASGIFNVKLDTPTDAWTDYVLRTLDDVASLSRRGFAFNALTSYSHPERRRADLYYADPCVLFDRCKQRFSRFVTLLHDYPLWEFTVLVRLGEPPHG
jgi:SAM-dependent methyltransferase